MGMEIIYATKDDQNTIVFHHPYWRTNQNQYKWLSRSSPFQQNVQHQATVISLFNIPKADPFAGRTRSDWEAFRNQNRNALIQQAWIRFPKAIDEMLQIDGWIFLREHETYIAIRPFNAYTFDDREFPDFYVIRSSGAVNAIISDIATTEQFETFAQFRSAVLAAPLAVNLSTTTPTVSYRNVRGDTITAQWNQPNYKDPAFPSMGCSRHQILILLLAEQLLNRIRSPFHGVSLRSTSQQEISRSTGATLCLFSAVPSLSPVLEAVVKLK
jgi:hypothetical protein